MRKFKPQLLKPQLLKLLTLLLVSVLVIAVIVVSCTRAPAEEPETPASDLETTNPNGQVLVFWYPFTQGHEETLLALVDEFNANNEWDITVIAEYAGPTDAIYEHVSDRIGSGDAVPEVVVAERHQVAGYAMQGGLVALDPYVDSDRWGYTWKELRDFFPFALATETLPQFEGHYSWPIHRSAQVLYYNEDWLAELGYTQPPRTWEEFEEVACAASDPELATYGYEFAVDSSTFADMLFSRGGQMINGDGTAYAFDSSEGLEGLTFLQTLLIDRCVVIKTERFGDRADFAAGKVLFAVDSTSNLPHYRSSVAEGAGFNWSVSPLPSSLDEPKLQVHGPSLAILEATPEKQLAGWLFLKWIAGSEQQARWARATHTLPIRISTVDLLADTFAEYPQYEKAFTFLDHDIAIEPGVTGYGECSDAIAEMLAAVADLEHPGTWLVSTEAACNAFLQITGE